MPLYRVVPVAEIKITPGAEAHIDGDEAEVGREDEVKDELLGVVVVFPCPFVKLDFVGGLVAGLDKSALHLFGPEGKIDEVMAAGARVGGQSRRGRVLLGIGRIGGMKGIRKNGMARDMVSPLVEGDSPGIRVRIAAEGDEAFLARRVAEPGRVLSPHRTENGLDLRMVKNRLTHQQVPVRRPNEIVDGMVAVLGPEA